MENRAESVYRQSDSRDVELLEFRALAFQCKWDIRVILRRLGLTRFYSASTLVHAKRKTELIRLMKKWISATGLFSVTQRASFVYIDPYLGEEIIALPVDSAAHDFASWNKRKLAVAILAMQNLLLRMLYDCGVPGLMHLLQEYSPSTLVLSDTGGSSTNTVTATATDSVTDTATATDTVTDTATDTATATDSVTDTATDTDTAQSQLKHSDKYMAQHVAQLELQVKAAANAAGALSKAADEVHEIGLYIRNAYASEIARGEHANQTLCQVLRRYLEKERMMAKAAPLRRMWLALKLW
jgi:ribosomal protein L30/L7E